MPTPDRAPESSAVTGPGARPAVEPFEADAVVVLSVGTALWVVAFGVLLALRGTLDRHDAGWWVWAAVAGIVIGLIGIGLASGRRARLRRGEPDPLPPPDPIP